MLNGTTSQSQSSGPTSVISDNMPGQILSQEHDSAPRSTDVATGSITVETQTDEAPAIETTVVQYDISTRAVIIIFIAISVQVILLSSLKNHL